MLSYEILFGLQTVPFYIQLSPCVQPETIKQQLNPRQKL